MILFKEMNLSELVLNVVSKMWSRGFVLDFVCECVDLDKNLRSSLLQI